MSKLLLFCTTFTLALFISSCEKDKDLPIVDFTYEIKGIAPTNVDFVNSTQNADSYKWHFGDIYRDFPVSRDESPTNYYEFPGRYEITLEASNGDGMSSMTQVITIPGRTIQIRNGGIENYLEVFIYFVVDDLYFYRQLGNLPPKEYSLWSHVDQPTLRVAVRKENGKLYAWSESFDIPNNTFKEINIYHTDPQSLLPDNFFE